MPQVRVVLPFHLRTLARETGEVCVPVAPPLTLAALLEAIEDRYPALRGTIRDHESLLRRPFIRYFACGQDFSLEPVETALPAEVAQGREPFLVVGAIAGG